MALEKLRLQLTSHSPTLEYDIYPIQDASDRQRKPTTNISVPGRPPSGTILLQTVGMQKDIEVQATLWDDGTDRSNGTSADTDFEHGEVVSVADQKQWLERYMHDDPITASWDITHTNGAMYSFEQVVLADLDIPTIQQGSPKWKEFRMTLRTGQTV